VAPSAPFSKFTLVQVAPIAPSSLRHNLPALNLIFCSSPDERDFILGSKYITCSQEAAERNVYSISIFFDPSAGSQRLPASLVFLKKTNDVIFYFNL